MCFQGLGLRGGIDLGLQKLHKELRLVPGSPERDHLWGPADGSLTPTVEFTLSQLGQAKYSLGFRGLGKHRPQTLVLCT